LQNQLETQLKEYTSFYSEGNTPPSPERELERIQ
jgi:hypothetical protein